MNTDTGEVKMYTHADLVRETQKYSGRRARAASRGSAGARTNIVPIDPANLTSRAQAQLAATGRTFVTRNSPCPCGSRKRFKRCCMTKP